MYQLKVFWNQKNLHLPFISSNCSKMFYSGNLLSLCLYFSLHANVAFLPISVIHRCECWGCYQQAEQGTMDLGDATHCPCCHQGYDASRKRKLTDACGHARCYSCMFATETCPLCLRIGTYSLDMVKIVPVNLSCKHRHETWLYTFK